MISEPHTSAVHHRGASVHDTVLGREIIHAATCQKTVSRYLGEKTLTCRYWDCEVYKLTGYNITGMKFP